MRTYINQRGRLAVLVSAIMITAMIAGLIPTARAAGTLTFSDVPESHTCYADIQWAARQRHRERIQRKIQPRWENYGGTVLHDAVEEHSRG